MQKISERQPLPVVTGAYELPLVLPNTAGRNFKASVAQVAAFATAPLSLAGGLGLVGYGSSLDYPRGSGGNILQYVGVSPESPAFGALGDGGNDDGPAWTAAAAYAVSTGRPLKGRQGAVYSYSAITISSSSEMPDMDFTGCVFVPRSAASTFVIEQTGNTGTARQKEIRGLHVKAAAFAVPVVVDMRNINSCLVVQPDIDAHPTSINLRLLNSIFWSENVTLLKPKFTGGRRHVQFSRTAGTDSFARFRCISPFHAPGNTTCEAFYWADTNVSVYDSHISEIGGNFTGLNSCVVYAGGDWSGSTIGPFPFEVNGGTGFLVKVGAGGTRKPTIIGNFWPLAIVDTVYSVQDDSTLQRFYPGVGVPQDNGYTLKATPTGLKFSAVGLPQFTKSVFRIASATPGTWYPITGCPQGGSVGIRARGEAVSGATNPPNNVFEASKATAFTGSRITSPFDAAFGTATVLGSGAPPGDGGQTIMLRWTATAIEPEIQLVGGVARPITVAFESLI